MSDKTLKNSHKNQMNLFLSILIKLGNIIIICFGIIIFGIKKLVFIKNKEKNSQNLLEYVEDLERRLNHSTRQFMNRDKKQSSYTKDVRYSNSQQPNRRTNVANKKMPKFITKKNIIYLTTAVCILVTSIFAGSLMFNGGDNGTNKTSPVIAIKASSTDENNESAIKVAITPLPDLSTSTPVPKSINQITENKPNDTKSNSVVIATATPAPTVAPTNSPVPAATSIPSNVDDEIMLHFKDTHEEVAKVQERLMELHYMDEDEPTTYYGAVTSFAVELFQRNHKLAVDGVAGAETIRLLYSSEAKPYLVRRGDKGTDIRQIQKRLVELGYLKSKSRDGRFDDDTDLAVRQFQGRNKLSQDGIVGYNTTQVLFNGDAKPAKNSKPTDSPSDGGSSGGGGSTGGGSSGGSASGKNLVSFAKSLLNQGIPYVWGGKSKGGLDCSGFVYYCLNNSGYKTGYRTSSAWAKSSFKTISSMSDLQVGDIVCFQGHVGIYIGDGRMIDSSSSKNGIRTTNIKSSSYWNRKWICGKRVF